MQNSTSSTHSPKNVICVSGDYRSGKSNFSKRLASVLGLRHLSMRELKNIYQSYVDWDIALREEDNKKIDQMVVDAAYKGNCILDFRFSALLCSLHSIAYYGIWISASLHVRIVRNAFRWNKSEPRTRHIIKEREQEEVRICTDLYGKSFRDPTLYHLSLDMSQYFLPVTEPLDTSPAVSAYLDYIKKEVFS